MKVMSFLLGVIDVRTPLVFVRKHKQITLEKAIHIITIPIKAHLRQKIID